ncbi:TPA: hypothetical protein ACF87N_002828 [Staphylococcus aureus]|uniref:hypothetical protein n=1 Tax=Staphylococcus TaxID=1279 RepID=UPI00044DC049|nr:MULTISPECIES: hypothetical protein [Staphylococcus]ELL5562798.1 hypothetical protein [Staphylococcus aureus]MCG2214128.1 hypothetical protein [Staphylococcus epidermidis]EWX53810.1 hypothetical protein V353_02757 [Staphylococcus aureus H59298]MDK7754201.1 hypothetical protein [Staphylococcus sp. UMB10092B]HDE4073682.1 hypothetical protein [Staphylococcus aureus]
MSKPIWTPTLKQVLKHDTEEVNLVSERTGNEYTAEVIPHLKVVSTGSVDETNDGKYRYAVVDTKHGLEYEIKVNKKINVQFGMALEFTEVRGGPTKSGGWYAAKTVVPVQNNA